MCFIALSSSCAVASPRALAVGGRVGALPPRAGRAVPLLRRRRFGRGFLRRRKIVLSVIAIPPVGGKGGSLLISFLRFSLLIRRKRGSDCPHQRSGCPVLDFRFRGRIRNRRSGSRVPDTPRGNRNRASGCASPGDRGWTCARPPDPGLYAHLGPSVFRAHSEAAGIRRGTSASRWERANW